MGFTNVAWESRDTEQLARDLTEGAGPSSVGQAGASWVRVANELAAISIEYDAVVRRLTESFSSQSAEAATRRIDEFGRWLQALSLSAAGNGQRAEEAAVAHSVAVLAMPTVPEAVEAQTGRDVMASLAAYNGAILNGRFAEFDDAATADQANGAAVMYQYEDACAALAAPWEQPRPPDVAKSAALQAERDAEAGAGRGGAAGAAAGAAAAPPPPLAPFRASEVKSSADSVGVRAASSTAAVSAAGGMGGMGGGYGPMAAASRGDSEREHESSIRSGPLAGGGEAGLSSASEASWLPAAAPNDRPPFIAQVSWGPNESVFGDVTSSEGTEAAEADDSAQTLEQVSRQWVAPSVIGSDREATR